MAHTYEDIITFHEAGLNWDDDLIALPSADGRIRKNVVISDEANYNVFTNVLGNLLKNQALGGGTFTYPAGTLKVIGFVENKEEQAGIFFVYSSTGVNSIIQYYSQTDKLAYVLDGSMGGGPLGAILNFGEFAFNDSGIIGNEDDKFLVWTDGINPPRMINIQMAIDYSAGVGGYPFINAALLSFYKPPYLDSWVNLYYINGTSTSNLLRGSLWQFAIRTKFIDKTYSVLSPFSPIPIPNDDEYINGVVIEEQNNNELYILVRDDTVLNPNIDLYQLCFRRVDIESGSPSEWYLSNIVGEDVGSSIRFNFTGPTDSIILDPDYAVKLQDWVPDLADHVGIIDSNRVVFGDVTEGYDNVPQDPAHLPANEIFNVSLSIVAESVPVQYDYEDSAYNNGATADTLVIDFSVTFGKYYKFFVVTSKIAIDGGQDYRRSFTYYNPGTKGEVSNYISESINLAFGATTTIDGSNDLVITGDAGNETFVYLNTTNENFQIPVFKTNANHLFGIVYLYGGKYGFVQKNDDDCVVSIPADTAGVFDSANTIQASINHIAPEGATHYQWAYLGSDVDYFEEYLMEIVADTAGNILNNEFITVEGDYLKINRPYLINITREAFGDAIDYGFDFQKGDIIFFKGEFTNWSINPDHNVIEVGNLTTFTAPLSTEILEVSSAWITIQNIIEPDFFPLYVVKYVVFDIIRRRNLSTGGIYQAIPGIYPIDTTTRYHEGNIQDQTVSLPAIVSFSGFGDTFFTRRIFVNDLNYEDLYYTDSNISFPDGKMYWLRSNSEQKNFSLMYPSQLAQFGKPNIPNEFAERGRFHNIRWGGKFLDDSGVNFMTKFDSTDQRIMDDRNGDINKIQQIGDTLKVYQQRKVNSLYLKTTASTGADGTDTYVFDTNNVMSEVRQSVTEYGCTHFSSYIKTVRQAYFFDGINATVLRDTPGGVIPIGDIKMQTYFREKVRQIQAYGQDDVEVLGGYDEYLNMYVLTFRTTATPDLSIDDTIAFLEDRDRWISFYSYIPEYYGKISGDTAIAFKRGMVYMQNKNPIRNNFFGLQYASIVDCVSKGDPSKIKVWDSIEIHSTGRWSPNEDEDIEIPIPIVMQSKLLAGKFKYQEGVYHSEFLRDDLNGGAAHLRKNLHNGRQLRGSVIRIRLRNIDTVESNLRLVNIKSTISL